MSRPTVSVVVPAYDRPAFLRDAITSVTSQTSHPLEIIVVNDCSPTDLFSALGDLAAAVRYERLPTNGGVARARNRGVELATGDLVAFLDDDDIWKPTYLDRQLTSLSSGFEAVLCGFSLLEGGREIVHRIQTVNEQLLRDGNRFCGASGFVARRETMLQEPWDESLASGEDWDLYIRLARRGALAYTQESIFSYRQGRHESLTRPTQDETLEELERRADVLRKHRAWLGEERYRRAMARYLLRFIGRRKNKLPALAYSIQRAGLAATVRVLADKVRRRENEPGA